MSRRKVEGVNDPCFLFIGSANTAADEQWLKENNIKVVLNVCNDIESRRYEGIVYIKWGLDDPARTLAHRNNVKYAATVLACGAEQAKNFDGNILVHCAAGHNRSALVAAVYLKAWKGWGLARAVIATEVHDCKPWMIDKGYIFEPQRR